MEKQKILVQLIAGVLSGTIIGIAGFLGFMIYGSNDCWSLIDTLFGTKGYESCGSFGFFISPIFGAILGITILTIVKVKNYSRASTILALSVATALFICTFILWSSHLLILFVPLTFIIGYSLILSLIIVGILNRQKIFKPRK